MAIHIEHLSKRYRIGGPHARYKTLRDSLAAGFYAAPGYRPRVRFEDGMAGLVEWVRQQQAVDEFERARQELARRGLAV